MKASFSRCSLGSSWLFGIALLIGFPFSNAWADGDRDWTFPKSEIPLGVKGSSFSVAPQTLAPGVSYYQVKRGSISTTDYWTVNIGFFLTQAAAQTAASDLAARGYTTRLDPAAGTHPNGDLLGCRSADMPRKPTPQLLHLVSQLRPEKNMYPALGTPRWRAFPPPDPGSSTCWPLSPRRLR
jgi:hypothetical protein